MPTTSEAVKPDLPRVLNLSHAIAIVVGTIIGSGIFLVPQEMMRAVGSSSLVYLAWIVGGLLSLFGAMTYAELGSVRPYAGGEYVYLRDAYGDLVAFLYMWTWFAVAKPASIATVTIGFARTLGTFHTFAFFDNALIRGPVTVTWAQVVAIGATWFITGINYLGMRKAGNFQLIFTWLKGVLIAFVIATCFFGASHGSFANFATSFTGARGGFAGFMIALIAALWAYDGWNDLNMVAGEIRNPQRNIPIALIAGVLLVGLLFIAVNAAIQFVLPADAIAATPRPALAAVATVLGTRGVQIVTVGMAFSILAGLNGTIMSGARIPFAAARDGLFFQRIAHIHPRFQSPSTSLVVQALLSTALLLVVGRFQQLFELAIFAEWLFYCITATTVFVYRRREPGVERPYRVWGYPIVPALFIAAAAVVLYYTFASNLRNSLLGTALILAGLPLYYLIRRNQRAASA
ncbi:MAG TPA: amino acid permease [Acidobacteriaceae bacterium]|nr:amino acid permease [Acidobacteriaceae bacterium]